MTHTIEHAPTARQTLGNRGSERASTVSRRDRLTATTRLIAILLFLAALILAARSAPGRQSPAATPSPADELGTATHIIVPTARTWELPLNPIMPEHPLAPPAPPPGSPPIHPPLPEPWPPGQPRVRPPRPPVQAQPAVSVESVKLDTAIRDAAASTTLDIVVRNSGNRVAESVVVFPLPFDAAVTAMELEGLGSEGVAKLLPRDEARRIYDSIVRRVQDPALVEFAGWNLIRTSVFPVQPGGTQRVRISFDHLLEVDGDRIDLLLPRSETMQPTLSWSITVDAASDRPIVEAYSPTHPLEVRRLDERRVQITANAPRPVPGPFRLSLLRAPEALGNPLTASILLSLDPAGGGGHFLIFGGLDPRTVRAAHADRRVPRELILVIDRSGSMRGPKMTQARDAALALVDALHDGDFVNVIDFSTTVNALYDSPRELNATTRDEARRYLGRIAPSGGTNIHDALVEALGQKASSAPLRTVLFLTDGLPTVGRTLEGDIRAAVERGNRHNRRVHAFGVGLDVNAPLLDRLGDLTRGSTTYVTPEDSIVQAAKRLVRVLDGPALLAPALSSFGPSGIADVLPASLPDLHPGDQMVILGRYVEGQPVKVRLEGTLATPEGGPEGTRVTREIVIDPSGATVRNAFVGRLWATRQIALLTDEVRQLTAPGNPAGPASPNDPRLRELTDQIVALSLRWGILTEYTSFLAVEAGGPGGGGAPAPIAARELRERTWEQLDALAVQARSDSAGVAQGMNYSLRKGQAALNLDNCFKDSQLRDVTTTQVCQVADRGFFKRGDAWVDGTLMAGEKLEPKRTVEFGSPEYQDLLELLARAGRQAVLGLAGDVYLDVSGETVLVRNGA